MTFEKSGVLFKYPYFCSCFFHPILLTPTYLTVLYGSGCCIRSMPYSTPLTAAKILKVADSHIHPVSLCNHDYQIFHLHRACPSTGLSTAIPETAEIHTATKLQGNKEAARAEERTRPICKGTAKRSMWKDLAEREDLGWLSKEGGQKRRPQHRTKGIEKLISVLKKINIAAVSTLIPFLSCQKHCPTGGTVNAFQK